MIGFLRGKVAHLLTDCCMLDVQGVGYRVFISDATRQKLQPGQEAMLFTHLFVREDALLLYGFASQQEYDMFQLLISVSGIGPKVAQGVLSAITTERLCQAIHGKKTAVLTKLPGIGKKSAERMILELKDKVSISGGTAEEEDNLFAAEEAIGDDSLSEARAALLSLGYTAAEIEPVLKQAGNRRATEDIIKFALKEFARR